MQNCKEDKKLTQVERVTLVISPNSFWNFDLSISVFMGYVCN